ncbi:MAG TPA: alpha/beta hydrolase [Bacteroidales bacterium]|jgi:pimeloyl-ACP methyl ester carboxylesterase|nr:alpha/beta hydrolase [Bacteroidales bacterium]NLH33700.1 alpha/beta hydrolase [Lentimicrobium sp.]MBP7874039.1 alpha/beta hydrolase [Bacteroidales bacterium]MCZ2281783.1 alpha/beta hydrolase [Bacteroidales bacterium]HPX33765.1 alpha/beta hydrolase [Bacteroidales bacterium]
MKKIAFKNKAIYYKLDGDGYPLVILHGFMGSSMAWNYFASQLKETFKVIRVDLPGHGKTPTIDKVHTMELMAEAVKTVLDHLNVKKCLMIGHSMGGYVTLEYAKQYPEMLKGIVLFHSHAAADTEESKENRRRNIAIVKLNKKGFVKQFIPDLFAEINVVKLHDEIEMLWNIADKTSAQGIVAALYGMKERTGKLDLLLNINIPVLFIAGKEDSRIPVQNVLAQAILPRHSEVLVLADVGHMGFLEAPGETLRMIHSFASKVFNE